MNESLPKSTTTANKFLSAAQTLDLLTRLRDAIRAIAARAEEHERDFATRTNALRVQYERDSEKQRVDSLALIQQEKNAAAEEQERAEKLFEARKSRLARAAHSARQRRIAEIESEESRRTREIQHQLIEADRKRDADIQSAKDTFEAFNARLADAAGAIDQTKARARFVLGGHPGLAKWLRQPPPVRPDLTAHETQLLESLHARLQTAEREIARCRKMVLPVIFRILPVWLWILVALAMPFALVPEVRQFDFAAVPTRVWQWLGFGIAGILAIYFLSRGLARPSARAAAIALEEARQFHETAAAKAQASLTQELENIRLVATNTTKMLNSDWKKIQASARSLRQDTTEELDEQVRRLSAANEERHRLALKRSTETHAAAIVRLTSESTCAKEALDSAYSENLKKLATMREAERATINHDWQNQVIPLLEELHRSREIAQSAFVPWQAEQWKNFQLPDAFLHAARFGELSVDLKAMTGVDFQKAGLELPGEKEFTVPMLVTVPDSASLLFETKQAGHDQVIGALNNLVLRLLTVAPPGRISFTIFDPVSLGQNFAGIMHLADYEERVISGRIWTQQAQFEERLADLNEHIEKVTQMYLRNEYESLAEYNANAGRLAEKYHFLVIADLPANFSDVAAKRLMSIVASGPRCGVHTFIHWDQRRPAPLELVPDELRKNSLALLPRADAFFAPAADLDGVKLTLDVPPDAELATQLLHQIGQASTDSYRVEMPFEEVVPAENEIWSLDTTRELRVPIGRTGATKLQYLALGQGTRQHGLIAGKTGSGKSTLFHVIVTNLAAWCSPDQVEFYLVDFKKGVEFKCYATHKLPHARVVAIESDREFGLSVLQRVDEELKRRGDLFRKLGAQDIAGYKRLSEEAARSRRREEAEATNARAGYPPPHVGGCEPMPRVLLLIDEFQELFVEDDRVSQGAALLLDRIVRQGRAFGIHVLLGSQTLGGAYSLARATIGQMVVRIALQCNEADAYLIMNEDNPAPRLLSRPGEAIYNDDGGAIQGNSPFQVVWLPDDVRDEWLAKIREIAERKTSVAREAQIEVSARVEPDVRTPIREPIVFEGNAPANVRDNPVLRTLLVAESIQPTRSPRVWLGAPNSIKGPTEAVFHPQSGNHLLIVGQREEAALSMLGLAQIALAVQHPKNAARVFVFDSSAPDSPEARFFERIARMCPDTIKLVPAGEAAEVVTQLAAELDKRNEQPGGPVNFLLVHDLQKHKKLRYDEEASFSLDVEASAGNPGLLFNKIITEGAALGFHVIANCDTYNNVMRMLSRKALSEFEMRVVFQMSANDSASLIDSPQANNLGLHRAILFNGQQGWMETFRPYALPDEAWLEQAASAIAKLHS